MLTGNILFAVYSVISIATSSIMSYLFWKRRNSTGALSISLVMLAAAQWSTFQMLASLCSNLTTKMLFDSLTFIGVTAIPVLWLVFSIKYTRQDKMLNGFHYLLLSFIPAITLLAALTSQWHHFFIFNVRTNPLAGSNLLLLEYDYGWWFWVHAAYSYLLILSGMIILLLRLLSFPKVYRRQALTMIIAILVPLVGNLMYMLGLGPSKNLDTTTFSFTFTGILLFVGMFRYRILDLVPIAYGAIISAMDDAVIILDTQKRIIDINSSAEGLFLREHNDLLGQPLSLLFDNEIPLFKGYNGTARLFGKLELGEEGGKKFYSVKISPLLDRKKSVIGHFLILSDITELEKTMEDLNKARITAENASKAKGDFLATMSHEIRTPINGIIGMAELLEDANLTSQERENLRTLEYSADSLLDIINEILDYSKIEAGKMQLESVGFNLRELIFDISKTFKFNKKLASIRFTYQIEESVPEIIVGDFLKLSQILNNLLSNAFKFTESGNIEVLVGTLSSTQGTVMLSFSVCDTGIGIAQDQIGNLFESFRQLDSSTTRKFGGTGLGLSIVKRLVELMGGSIKVESTPGSGSRFTVQLPFETKETATNAEILEAAYTISCQCNPKILIAEDSKVNQLVLLQYLKKKGWKADVSQTGIEALEKFKAGGYDIVLMDIQMPGMDGYEAAKAIREFEQLNGGHIPIVALTANATEEDRNKCLSSGMDDFLSKPVKSETLYSCIQKNCCFTGSHTANLSE